MLKNEPPLTLDRLASFFYPLLKDTKFNVYKNHYDSSISISIITKENSNIINNEVFRVYYDGHVADNRKFIESIGHPECYKRLKSFIESMGLKHFHNHYLDYLDKRLEEAIR
ncbi:hypothetical protein GF336_06220 [Candidatus Woesearchaeota archaeon]|nr:hypothetical protein [Candidatus Woesearchaeota archaeon]